MPGKVNPVIPEAVTQAAMEVMANDQAIAQACAAGNLELNPFLPLVAECLLESLDLLAAACDMFAPRCVAGIEADEARCRRHVESTTAMLTALVERHRLRDGDGDRRGRAPPSEGPSASWCSSAG